MKGHLCLFQVWDNNPCQRSCHSIILPCKHCRKSRGFWDIGEDDVTKVSPLWWVTNTALIMLLHEITDTDDENFQGDDYKTEARDLDTPGILSLFLHWCVHKHNTLKNTCLAQRHERRESLMEEMWVLVLGAHQLMLVFLVVSPERTRSVFKTNKYINKQTNKQINE